MNSNSLCPAKRSTCSTVIPTVAVPIGAAIHDDLTGRATVGGRVVLVLSLLEVAFAVTGATIAQHTAEPRARGAMPFS